LGIGIQVGRLNESFSVILKEYHYLLKELLILLGDYFKSHLKLRFFKQLNILRLNQQLSDDVYHLRRDLGVVN